MGCGADEGLVDSGRLARCRAARLAEDEGIAVAFEPQELDVGTGAAVALDDDVAGVGEKGTTTAVGAPRY